jgi:predicted GIY-YIG superfamily endonuclease
MYILECSNGTYYIGSTRNLFKRVAAHQNGIGANYTKKHLPVCLVYFEKLKELAACKNETSLLNVFFGFAQETTGFA